MTAPPTSIERRPRCRVTVGAGTASDGVLALGQGNGVPLPLRSADITALPLDLTSYVTSVRTVKSLHTPLGSFDIGLTFQSVEELRASSLSRILAPDNLVQIQLDRGFKDTALETVMLGWISTISMRTSVSPRGEVRRELVVSGYDGGKFLARHELPGVMATLLRLDEEETRARREAGFEADGTVGEIQQELFEKLYLNWSGAPQAGRGSFDILTHPALHWDGGSPPPAAFALASWTTERDIWSKHGVFWNVLREFADEPWNLIYGDYVVDPKARFGGYTLGADHRAGGPPSHGQASGVNTRPGYYVIVEPKPFDPPSWKALPVTTVYDREISFEQVARSDDERINFVTVTPAGDMATGDYALDDIVWQTTHISLDSARRHGLRGFHPSTIYSDIDSAHGDPSEHALAIQGKGKIGDALAARSCALWRWYAVNDQLWKGTWVVMGNPAIRIGTRVENQSTIPSGYFDAREGERRTYFVERVIQDYVDGSHFLTHLALTRGQPIGSFVQPPTPDSEFAGARSECGSAG